MRRPKVIGARLLGLAALPLALVTTAGIVSATSYSVFSGTTSSPNNSFTTGGVVLKNDSSGAQTVTGSALFTTAGTPISPTSAAVSRCVTVQSTTTLPTSAVRLYVQNASTTNTLAQYLDVKVEVGTATSTAGGSCASFVTGSTLFATGPLSTFETTYPSYANSLSTGWTPAASGTDTKVFKVTVGPGSTMTNSQQSQTHSVDLVWEADQS